MNSQSNVVNIADYTTAKIREQKIFASEVDKQIGIRIRIARHMNGRKQEELANYLGLTLPQTQKYENGENKVSVNMIMKIAEYFCLPIGFFVVS